MKTRLAANSWRALTRVEVLVVVLALLLVASLLVPSLVASKVRSGPSKRIACVNNLRQIGLSFRIWPNDSSAAYQMRRSITNGGTLEWVASGEVWPHFLVMSNELNTPKLLICPADKNRSIAAGFDKLSNSNISYFVGLDANQDQFAMLLAGDNNLEVDGQPVGPGPLNLWTNSALGWTADRHLRHGNVALADGSVQQYSSARLREALANTGMATNRLAMP